MIDFINALIDIIKLLAADAEEQLNYLAKIGVAGGIDELALEFEDVAILAQSKLNQGQINEIQYQKICDLNQKLIDMSGEENAVLWTEEALRESDDWKAVRRLARNCLEVFGSDQPAYIWTPP
ncbi:MAG: hypothetical protein ACREBC_28585, partial [Pyrinomonadaceae bacterium]